MSSCVLERRVQGARGEVLGVAVEALLHLFDEPFTVEVDRRRREVFVQDRGRVSQYELALRPGARSWVEVEPGEGRAVRRRQVTTSEVMALAREAGKDEEVAHLVEDLIAELAWRRRAAARRKTLARELRQGRNLEHVALRQVQQAVLRRLREGVTLDVMAQRAGFVNGRKAGPRGDTSWFLRRAGFAPVNCAKRGLTTVAKVARYADFLRLVRAVDMDPVELGV